MLALLRPAWQFLMMKRFYFSAFLLVSAAFALPDAVYAQDAAVNVRAGLHDDYARLVFDWQNGVSYDVSVNDQGLRISFNQKAALGTVGLNLENIPALRSVRAVSGAGEDLVVQVNTATQGDKRYRDFKVGHRVVVDVMGTGRPAPRVEQPKVEPEPDDTPESKATASKQVKTASPEEMDAHPAEDVAEAPLADSAADIAYSSAARVGGQIMDMAPKLQPHVITVSQTKSVGLAAFRRGDNLWIVMDRPDISVPPDLEGPQTKIFPEFERFALEKGTAYRLKLPEGYQLRLKGEGGGLVWRIILSPSENDESKPVEMERRFDSGTIVRGGTAVWKMTNTTRVIGVPDPEIGDIIEAVTVKRANQYSGTAYDFVDFAVLESPIGMAVEPKTDTLEISLAQSGVEVTRSDEGLALARASDIQRRKMRERVKDIVGSTDSVQSDMKTIFFFDSWMMGGLHALAENQRIVLSNAAGKNEDGRAQDLISLAKVNLANDRGQEAIGMLELASQELPAIQNNAEYSALRGAAYALAGKYELALSDLTKGNLAQYDELDYWRAYTLAWLEDWQQAGNTLPADLTVLTAYPLQVLEKLGIKLAEVALRAGDVSRAGDILDILSRERKKLDMKTKAGLDYLEGEAARQRDNKEDARKVWERLARGKDDFYRARAGLALTMMDYNDGKVTAEEAIDRLEGLRYAWRGDGLEAQINSELGKLYLNHNELLKGFTILRDAVAMSPGTDTGKDIARTMSDQFYSLLMDNDEISPVEAVTVYEEFKELTPAGEDGNKLIQRLAERLVDGDLLGRATTLLQHQVDFRLSDEDKARVALRLGAIYLLDSRPGDAIKALNTARSYYAKQDSEDGRGKQREIKLLRARALSQLGQTGEALALLNSFPPAPDVNSLRADTAWQAGMWDDAAEGLRDLILDQKIDLSTPLNGDQASLILNRAVALNLSGNRVELANMREKYGDAMKKTTRSDLFDVVTLPRKNMVFVDKRAINELVKDADIFRSFLESYKNEESR